MKLSIWGSEMSEWNVQRKKEIEDNLKLIRELPLDQAIEHALRLRSDDFGHSTSDLMECESRALEIIGERVLAERAARVVSDGELSEMAHDFWQWAHMENEDRPRSISHDSYKAGFKKATELNSIVALDELLPSERDYREFLYDKEKHVGQFPILNWLKSYLKEKLGKV